MHMLGFVYLIRNAKNGKIYVGQTRSSIQSRFKQHTRYAIKGNSQLILYHAIRKHGVEAFSIVELSRATSQEELNQQEIFFIEKLRSRDPKIGYNIALGGYSGGSLGKLLSEETKKKISQTLLGKTMPQETRAKISDKLKGKTFSKERNEKISKALKGRKIALGTKLSEQACKNISEGLKGRTFSESHRKAISDSWTPERYAKFKEALKRNKT